MITPVTKLLFPRPLPTAQSSILGGARGKRNKLRIGGLSTIGGNGNGHSLTVMRMSRASLDMISLEQNL